MGLLVRILVVVLAVILVLTGGRFLALLVGANEDSDLVQQLYDWSEFWVEPFFEMFGLDNEAVEETGGVFEPASLIAFVTYAVIGTLVLGFLSGRGFGRFRHA